MRLKTRLQRLEPAAQEAWREDWQRLAEEMNAHAPQAVRDRLELALAPLRSLTDAELEARRRASDPQRELAELQEALGDTNLGSLDLAALLAWFRYTDIPDPDRPDLSRTPATLPAP